LQNEQRSLPFGAGQNDEDRDEGDVFPVDDMTRHSATPSIDAQRQYWDLRWNVQRSPNPWQKRRADVILSMLRDLRLRDPRILDLGCATGWMTSRLSEIGSAEGLDLSDAAIEIARAQHPGIRFTAGDLYDAPLGQGTFDVVVCQEVIAHVVDQPRLIRLIADVMRPGGYLVITTANRLVMDRMRDEDGIGVGPADPAEHVKKWLHRRELVRLLEPRFIVHRTASVIPMGHRGVLRIINSHKLNRAIGLLVPPERIERMKERAGLGYSIIALAQKIG